ncbi:hypothetical protein EDD16DRAFT_1787743 [Pisolithus croceorrhizus]|nr:hypothetical protein EDD16DRAFT_1787743 [Pisolithus croceorrhizus]KAI6106203.1 hypothetical protein EV401DRAFT_2124657 [Pisolithus croceorrhizus]
MPNQNKPTSPIEEIELHIMCMWKVRFNDRQIVEELHKLIDTNQYGIGNLQLILTYYLDVVEEFGFIPLVTQSNPGSENFGIANAQTMLHQWHDHALEGTLQHRWMRSRKNIKPEIMWSQLHWHFTPGFKTLLDEGVHQGWYDIDNTLQLDRVNHTAKRCNHNKVLPHGIPELIFSSPQDYGALDLKFMVDKAALKHVCQLYVNTGHAVFNLVPHLLSAHLEEHYNDLGRPTITCQTVWRIYLDLLHTIQDHALTLHHHISLSVNADMDDELPLLEGQHDLPFNETDQGYYYMGGVGGGLGLDEGHVHRLDGLDSDEEENLVEGGPDVVVTEFSDEELAGSEDDWM